MTQRATFTKKMIVDAAFDLTRNEGWGAVSARSLARKLESSTMPLYSILKSMEEIEKAVRARAEVLLHEFQHRTYTDPKLLDPLYQSQLGKTELTLLDSAVGYVIFARDEPHLFRFLYVERPVTEKMAAAISPNGQVLPDAEAIGGAFDLVDQAAAARRDPTLLLHWAFTHGLASLISSHVIDLSNQRISSLLLRASSSFSLQEQFFKNLSKGVKNE